MCALVQGTFGEISKVAVDQLSVVRSCAYHLLNMINMERDMLKMLNGGDPELTTGMAQIANPIEEVCGCMWIWMEAVCVGHCADRKPV